jgi:hypothetical protein
MNTTDKVCQWLVAGQWFSPSTTVSSTNKTDCHNITEILLKVVLNTICLCIYIFSSLGSWRPLSICKPFQKFSFLKPLNQFEPNLATIILRVSSLKFVSDVPVPITTKVVSLNPTHVEVYSIQHYVISLSVICDRWVVFSGFLHQ